jgi:hypothetical protein
MTQLGTQLHQICLKSSEQTFVGTQFRASENVCHEGGLLTSLARR